jgi:8-oxo-dGTP pyrophosphatase MutT (NUDIX family)
VVVGTFLTTSPVLMPERTEIVEPVASAHLHADAIAVLQEWQHDDTAQLRLRDEYLAHLNAHPDGMERACRIGHLTASALVMNASRDRVLLTLHPKVGRWLQLGGHCEVSDDSLHAAALREAVEEGGIADVWVSMTPIRLDRHPVPCAGAMSEHLDVQFLAIVDDNAVAVISDESDDLAWFAVDALPADADESVRALVTDARASTRSA